MRRHPLTHLHGQLCVFLCPTLHFVQLSLLWLNCCCSFLGNIHLFIHQTHHFPPSQSCLVLLQAQGFQAPGPSLSLFPGCPLVLRAAVRGCTAISCIVLFRQVFVIPLLFCNRLRLTLSQGSAGNIAMETQANDAVCLWGRVCGCELACVDVCVWGE